MAEEMSYVISEKEYEALAVLRDVICLVTEEVESNLKRSSPALDMLRSFAIDEVSKAEIVLFY